MAPRGKKPLSRKKAAPPGKKGTAARSASLAAPVRTKKPGPIAAPAYPDLEPGPAPILGNIPWGYGDVRIVGMARDPHWACAYWEITDASIQAAREKLGDPHAGLCLRVYDTTHRDFNGLNAHTYWDLVIDRSTQVYHFKAGRPGATLHVDVGVRNWQGGFHPIARSNAVEMPRDSMSPDGRIEATTVFRSGLGYTYRHRYTPPPRGPELPPPPPPPESLHPAESEAMFTQLAGEGWKRSEWVESLVDGRVVRWIRWSGPITPEHLSLLPLPKTLVPFRSIEILFQGERRVVQVAGGEKVVYGPWKVTLEAVGPKGERKTMEQWMIRSRWTTQEGMIRVETPAILVRIFGGARVRVVQSGSESRLAQESWGSQTLQLGSSEWRWIGASENLAQGSSELLQAGASEFFYLGSSETWALGASEQSGGASDLFFGSSEDRP